MNAFVIGVITVIGVIDSKKIEIASVIALIIVIGVIGAKKISDHCDHVIELRFFNCATLAPVCYIHL